MLRRILGKMAVSPKSRCPFAECFVLDSMNHIEQDNVRTEIRTRYAEIAQGAPSDRAGCCGTSGAGCQSALLGYSEQQLQEVPEGADMGLGCGNPQVLAALQRGQVVLDLGAGGGFDCFLAAAAVGSSGRVIGVDMTPEMVSLARKNAAKTKNSRVEFRLGEIENLPVGDGQVDVVLSNCVINLSPNKAQVFAEAFRVLRPEGKLAISDVIATAPLPAELQRNVEATAGCISGAIERTELIALLENAGFEQIVVKANERSCEFMKNWIPGSGVENFLVSASIEAQRPGVSKACCGADCC